MRDLPGVQDRESAAGLLALRLRRLKGNRPLVLAIPRGAVPMASILARQLEGDLDIVLVRKLGAPGDPETAIDAVDESGEVAVLPGADRMASRSYVEDETRRQLQVLRRRRASYTPDRGPIPVAGRRVVLVDDGVATGATLEAAVRTVLRNRPAELIVATGVISPAAFDRLKRLVDEVVCLVSTDEYFSVGQFYADFREVSDEEVTAILLEHEPGGPAGVGNARGGSAP